MESEDETKKLRSAVLETATSVLQIRQRAEQEIRRANEVLERRTRELDQALVIMRATLESTTDAILVIDEKGKVTDFNENYIDMWKIPREVLEGGMAGEVRELASRNFAEPQRFLARIEEITDSNQQSFDLLELKDGRIFERHSKVLTIEGQSAGRVWSFRDVTGRHLAEITSRRLAAIVASSDDAIVGKDLNSIVTSWNLGAERIFGYSADEMIGTSIMRLIPPDRQEEEIEILSRIRRGERFDHFETIRLAKDGRQLNVSITVSPIKDPAGHVIGASKVARDITERKQAEEALKKAMAEADAANRDRQQLLESEREACSQAERASRTKDEFLATLSHELRTPLNAVLGWANVLRLGKAQGEELEQGLDTIERNARIQAQIIEDLLDMSAIISGKVRLDVQRVDLPAVLKESIETLRATAEAKGIRLHTVVDPFAGPIYGDPNRLQQVFWNLLSNAIKFTPKGGKVQVLLERVNSQVEASVIDTGEGIAAEFLPYVFDRFQQADASTTRRHGGLGLGLAIVKQLVELHGGNVRVKSAGIGQGATFTVRLPLIALYSEPNEERRHPLAALCGNRNTPEVSLANVHVLVVDDEIDGRELVKRLLEMAGATVSMAGSVSEAMERVLARRPDVLVCDIGMRGEDGYSLIRRLRVLEENQESALPAVALTAYARSEDRTKAIRSGFQNHLAKPVEPAELLAVVSSLVGRRVTNQPDAD
ncbi:MAG: PAS domain S-box protein [Chthoniobacterales bacterium]